MLAWGLRLAFASLPSGAVGWGELQASARL